MHESGDTPRCPASTPVSTATPTPPLVSLSVGPAHPAAAAADTGRSDAARNRALLLLAAQRLIDARGAAAVTMDEVAREAGVGKGTVFRRFGSRAGLMMALLDHSETELQRSFMSGPPPLGPGAAPTERLLAYGRARLAMVYAHLDVLMEADDAAGRHRLTHPARAVAGIHVRNLLSELGFTENVTVATMAVLGPLEATAVHHLLHHERLTLAQITHQWELLVHTLCDQGSALDR
ncbi:TetR/AcrR family transcriptional regulator [Williamsia sp. CHRR-6]|uniref:TetR/AcrR family transcriptional regulator n=1 Tax=Williamsia sp. CHRR-6 TaxID=2835871 RepID=UPI001BDA8CAD|nr:TetR/AcrR family transcriptional regulator [Williamsia sp. CHRR-6]MBT0565499.1 helix-turn-helix transcriptional regulator [Williamsia sp. CHRR-6]